MNEPSMSADILFHLGPFDMTDASVTSFGLLLFLGLMSLLLTRSLQKESSRLKMLVEGVVLALEGAVAEVLPKQTVRQVFPFVATLWLFVLTANLAGLIPGLHSPTRDLSITSALAILVFASTHWYGIRIKGWRAHLRHYAEPSIILLPFHIISELTRTLALAVRLFGNMMSLEMTALLVLMIAGFLVPVPVLMLHVIEALVQAYIFGILALIYIAGALEEPEQETNPSTT